MAAAEERIAKIAGVRLGWEDHGIFTCMVDLDYGSSGQAAGGYALDSQPLPGERDRRGTAFGMQWVQRLMRAAGVGQFHQVQGRTVIALIGENGRVAGLKPLPTEGGTPFVFADLAAEHQS